MNNVDQILETVISKLKGMADADTVVGKPVVSPDGTVLIPVSKLSVGFVAGGGEYSEVTLAGTKKEKDNSKNFPFAGGTGAGLCISPVAFISIAQGKTQVFSVEQKTPMEKILDMVPDVAKTALKQFGLEIENDDSSEKQDAKEGMKGRKDKQPNVIISTGNQ